MRDDVKSLVWYMSTTHDLNPPIVEIGSRAATGHPSFVDMRPFFKDKKYIGCDLQEGPGVDRIEDVMNLSFPNGFAHTVLCLDTIEHVADPVRATSEMFRILHEDGVIVITTHMYAPMHMPDYDYWRITPTCMQDVILKQFDCKIVLIQGNRNYPHNVVGIGVKSPVNVAVKPRTKIDFRALNGMLPWPYPFPYVDYEGS